MYKVNNQILKMHNNIYKQVLNRKGGAILDWHDTPPNPDSVPRKQPVMGSSDFQRI